MEKKNDDQRDLCAVCMEALAESMTTLPCTHAYHQNCIDLAAVHDRRCPVCYGRGELWSSSYPTEAQPQLQTLRSCQMRSVLWPPHLCGCQE
jgi:hypothetical protein